MISAALVLASSLIILSGDVPAPQYFVEPNSTHGVLVDTEGHPNEIAIVAIVPNGIALTVKECFDVSTCSVNVIFPQCGIYLMNGVIAFAFAEPGGSVPYVNAVAAAVTVTGCAVFSDGFEDGTTDQWSATTGG